jgi:hypothetical protein
MCAACEMVALWLEEMEETARRAAADAGGKPESENPETVAPSADPKLRPKAPTKPAFVCEETRSE